MILLFWTCLLLLAYVFQGYLLLLRMLPATQPKRPALVEWPMLTVLLTVHNEEDEIVARLDNLLDQNYPRERLQILVASDGSSDRTEALVRAHGDPVVSLFRAEGGVGKTATQNLAMAEARGELVVFTDAGTRFEPGCLKALAECFADSSVGGATGNLFFSRGNSGVARDQSRYWAYEQGVRARESQLGLLAVATGACLAVRRELFRPMPVALAEDCVLPLDIVAQGRRFVLAPTARAWDRMPDTSKAELRTRARMTQRDWQGMWHYARLLSPLHHPGYAWALWSHKILRWCSPLWLAGATFATLWLSREPGSWRLVAAAFGLFYGSALVGLLAEHRGWRLPLIHTAYSFLLANLGFGLGLARALLGQTITRYPSERVSP